MSEFGTARESGSHSAESMMKSLLQEGEDELLKGKLMLEHSLGLGPQPNVIPPGKPNFNGEHRTVKIGWHPVAGFAGKWFAEKTGLGRKITQEIHKYPDPTQHWAVLVGEYSHQLWMDEHLDVIYINGDLAQEEWHTFEVGKTRFNDEALRHAGEMVIFNMRAKQPAYNLINNNCQNFALQMLDAIQVGGHKQFVTSFTVFQRAKEGVKFKDLFVEGPKDAEEEPPETHQHAIERAQKVMEENTTKLDNHRSLF